MTSSPLPLFHSSPLPQVQITIISTNQFHGCMQGLRKALEKEVTAAMATRRLPARPTPAQLTALKENSKVAQSDPYKLRSFLKLIEEVRDDINYYCGFRILVVHTRVSQF